MASHQRPGSDLEMDGMDQTGSNQSGQDGTNLDQLMNKQAQLLQQLQSSHSVSAMEESANVANGAVGGSASSDQETAANSETASICSPEKITMPGLQPFSKANNQLPSSWSDCALSPDVPFCLVMLNKQSWEFQSILAEFTDADLIVKKIERVENRDSWEKFEFERRRMLKNRTEVNEVYLFHGTTADKEQICHEGLDQRLSRIGYFGRGIYFSNDPRKCVSYTQKGNPQPFQDTTCTVYKCRALLGNMKVYPSGQHAKDLKREPEVENQEPGGPKYYDSVKGHVKLYDEFILYKSERVMPEYVISCFPPAPPSGQEPQTVPVAASTTNHRDQKDEDMYGNLDQDEVSAELEAEARQGVIERTESLENLYAADDEEISAELEAGALGPLKGHVERRKVEMGEDEEMSSELTAEGAGSPGTEDVESEDNHPELEGLSVYEQLHQKEIYEAFEKTQGRAGRKEQAGKQPQGVTVNQLEEVSEELHATARGSDATCVASKTRKVPPPKQAPLPKSASVPQIIQNPIEEPGRAKKEKIAPEFLPLILQVRERVQESRRKEKEEQDSQMKGGQNASERKTPRWVREDPASAWTPAEYAEQQKVIAKVRAKVQAERRAEELELKRRQAKQPQGVMDNSLSPGWQDQEENDGVQEVLDVLIVQFMDVTACDDIVEARECILKANMDVNTAIVSYFNG